MQQIDLAILLIYWVLRLSTLAFGILSIITAGLTNITQIKFARLNICCIVLTFVITGCATWTQHGVTPSAQQKFRIVVLPIQSVVEITKISDIQTTPSADVLDEKEWIWEQIRQVTSQLSDSLKKHLAQSTYVEVIPTQPTDATVNDRELDVPKSWNLAEIEKLALPSEAQAVLLVKLSGYGKLKKKWLTYLIGTGIVEGVVQGVVVAKAVSTPWAGVAVALEEILQEVFVWGGSAYLFNWAYAPVTLEAELVSTLDASVIWEDTVFVSADKEAINALPEDDRKKKEIQLRLTAEKAIRELSADLEKAAKRNLPMTTSNGE